MAQNPTNYSSPEALKDGRVTFRLFAPGAKAVATVGAWDNWQQHKMTRDAAGL
jgi:1,4-alpha-glucan branching enzyme